MATKKTPPKTKVKTSSFGSNLKPPTKASHSRTSKGASVKTAAHKVSTVPKAKQEDIKLPTQQPSEKSSDRLIWYERARAMQVYSNALKDADEKALELFSTVTNQIKEQFKHGMRLYLFILTIVVILLGFSVYATLFSPQTDTGLRTFGFVGIPVGFITLIVFLFRNPIINSRHVLESVLRLNVVFLSFIRRLQKSDLLLQYTFYEDNPMEISKLYSLIQDFENEIAQTYDEMDAIR